MGGCDGSWWLVVRILIWQGRSLGTSREIGKEASRGPGGGGLGFGRSLRPRMFRSESFSS